MSPLTDTHCHIHSADYPLAVNEVRQAAVIADVGYQICVGTDAADSQSAINFAQNNPGYWASVGVHPNDQAVTPDVLAELRDLVSQPKVVAVGECGLDYFYEHLPRQAQQASLRAQIELAIQHDLPLIFHVRNAFDDFWPIFDEYAQQLAVAGTGQRLRGVLHSFTDTQANANKGLERGLYIGVNGITTFTKNQWQLDIARDLPLDRILLETDAPFLTPVPHRGKVNMPAFVRDVAEFLAVLRGDSLEHLTAATTHNARQLFNFH